MRALLVIFLAVVALSVLGWVKFSHSSNSATVTVETTKIKKDVDKAVERGKEFAEDARRKGHQWREGSTRKDNSTNSPAAAPETR